MKDILDPIAGMTSPKVNDFAVAPRALLIAYHFYPDSATGAARWIAMTRDLVSAGWRFDVIARAPERPKGDRRGRKYEPDQGIRIFPVEAPTWLDTAFRGIVAAKRRAVSALPRRTPHAGPRSPGPHDVKLLVPGEPIGAWTALTADLDWARHWFAELLWSRRAIRVGRELARREPYRVILVSSPPHATQLVGAVLSRETGTPYVADLRDPWLFGDAKTRSHGRIDAWCGRFFEPRTLPRARFVICNTERARRAFETWAGGAAPRAVCIGNGYDVLTHVSLPDPKCFRVVFTGNLYPSMDVRPLLSACRRLRDRSALPAEAFRIEFMGTGDTCGGVALSALARAYGLEDCFRLYPRATRDEASRLQQCAGVIVVIDNPPSWLAVPTKFYDATQMYGAILLLGEHESALRDAAGRIGIPMCDPRDTNAIDATLDRALKRWRTRDFARPADGERVFDRRHQSRRLHELLSAIDAA